MLVLSPSLSTRPGSRSTLLQARSTMPGAQIMLVLFLSISYWPSADCCLMLSSFFFSDHTIQQVTEDPDSRSSEPRQEIDTTDSNTLLQDLLADLGIKSTSAPKKAKKSLENAEKELSMILSLLEETSGIKIPPISEPIKQKKGSEKKEEEFKFQDRPLNSQESTGLWTLAGILGGGLVLGTLGSGKKKTEAKESNDSKKH